MTKLWAVQALACGGDGGATKNIISPKFSNFGDIIIRGARFLLKEIFGETTSHLTSK